jgi:hypothetical protein
MLALIFGAILLCRVLGDKAGTAAYDRQRDARQKQEAEWEAKYTDRSLEYRLTTFIEDPRNSEAVRNEVIPALKEMIANHGDQPLWTYIINGGVVPFDLALDIMLANRGKISNNTAHWGFEAHNKMAGYARCEWIRDTLQKQGVYATPLYIKEVGYRPAEYVWEGSPASHPYSHDQRPMLRFEDALIEPKPVEIPPAYYNKTE